MTTICDPAHLRYPHYPSKAIGSYIAHVVIWPYPTEDLTALLPDALELAPQDITPASTHPVVMLFGRHAHVRPDFIPFGGMNYHEFIFAIPFVQWKDPNRYAFRGPFAYMPRLYLDKVFATLLGYMYAYPKMLARIHGGDPYTVHDLLLDRPLIKADFTARGDQKPPDAFANFAALKPIFEIPFVGKMDATPYVCSRLTFHLEDALMRASDARVELQYEFLPGILPDTRISRGLDIDPLGCFELNVPWDLTLPFNCGCLKCES